MDYRIEQWINSPAGHHPGLDAFMAHAATWAVEVFIGIVAIWFLIGWSTGSMRDRRGAVLALLASGGALLANQIINRIWARPRPFVAHPGTVHMLIAKSSDPSFPSDHAAAAFAIAVAVFLVHRRIGLVVIAAALLVAYARVYVGAHYPGDVLGGAILGTLVTLLLWGPLAVIPNRVNDALTWLIRTLHLPLPDRERLHAPPG